MSLITATGLIKQYRSKVALNTTFEFPEGMVIALIGPNGAGKSTLLDIASGLTKQNAGSIRLFENVRPGTAEAQSSVASLSQEMPIEKTLSVKAAIATAEALNLNFDRHFAVTRVNDLDIPLGKKVGQLSGGQRAQVALTLALARRPRALLLDEPTAALDPLARHEFLAGLMSGVAETGVSVVFSSHSIEELNQVCDHVALLTHGEMKLNDDIESILANHVIVTGDASEISKMRGVDLVSEDRTARIGHHLCRVTDHSAIRGLGVSAPSLNQVILGYMRERNQS